MRHIGTHDVIRRCDAAAPSSYQGSAGIDRRVYQTAVARRPAKNDRINSALAHACRRLMPGGAQGGRWRGSRRTMVTRPLAGLGGVAAEWACPRADRARRCDSAPASP